MVDPVFEFFITPRTGTEWDSEEIEKKAIGTVTKLEAVYNHATECECYFYPEDIDGGVISLDEVLRGDRLEVKLFSNTIFYGLILEKIVSASEGQERIIVKAQDLSRPLSEKQLERVIHNGLSDAKLRGITLKEVDGIDQLTTVIDSTVQPMAKVEKFSPHGNFDARKTWYNGLASYFPTASDGDVNLVGIVFKPRSTTITKLWLYLGDQEDTITGFQPTFGNIFNKANKFPQFNPISIELVPTRTTLQGGGTQDTIVVPSFDATEIIATYEMSNWLKEGWTVWTNDVAQASAKGPFSSTTSFTQHLLWDVTVTGSGGSVEVIEDVDDASGLNDDLGDNRAFTYAQLDCVGNAGVVTLGTDEPGNLDESLRGRRSATGRFSFALRWPDGINNEPETNVHVYLKDFDGNEFKAATLHFRRVSGAYKIFLIHGETNLTLNPDGDEIFGGISTASGQKTFFHFTFDTDELLFDLFIQNTSNFPGSSGNKLQVGPRFTLGYDTEAAVRPVRISKWEFETLGSTAGKLDVGWVVGNEVGNSGVMPETVYDDARVLKFGLNFNDFLVSETVEGATSGAKGIVESNYNLQPGDGFSEIHLSTEIGTFQSSEDVDGFISTVQRNTTDVSFRQRSLCQDMWKWAQVDFSDNPIDVNDLNNLAIVIRQKTQAVVDIGLDPDPPAFDAPAAIKLGITRGESNSLSDAFSVFSEDNGDTWIKVLASNESPPMFIIEYADSWIEQIEGRHFTVDYDDLELVWGGGANQQSGSFTDDLYRLLRSPEVFRTVRLTQYTNPDSGGIVRIDRKMRLRDVIVKLVSFIDDPLNPGFPPLVIIDKNLNGIDDEVESVSQYEILQVNGVTCIDHP